MQPNMRNGEYDISLCYACDDWERNAMLHGIRYTPPDQRSEASVVTLETLPSSDVSSVLAGPVDWNTYELRFKAD